MARLYQITGFLIIGLAALTPSLLATEPALSIDPALVVYADAIAPDIARQITESKPVVAHFHKDGHDLYYIAASHETQQAHVIVEGRPYELGDIPAKEAER